MSPVKGMVTPGHRHRTSGIEVVLRRVPGVTRRKLLRRSYHFQVAPLDEFGWEQAYNWVDYETLRKGQMTRDGGRQLKTVTFSSLVVDHNPQWAVWAGGRRHSIRRDLEAEAPNPLQVARQLEKLLEAGTPIRLIARNRALYDRPEIDMPATLRSVNVRERAGEVDARYFDLSFVEWREPQLRRRGYGKKRSHELPAVVRIGVDGVVREVEVEGDRVKKGERHKIGKKGKPATLRKLAKHFYGEQSGWHAIARKNGIKNFGPEQGLDELHRRGRKHRRLTIPRRGHDKGRGGKDGKDGKDGKRD